MTTLRDSRHFHPVLAVPAGAGVGPYLALRGAGIRAVAAVEHEHPVDAGRFGGRHYHSEPVGPNGEPLGYSAAALADVAPPELRPSDDARVRLWRERQG